MSEEGKSDREPTGTRERTGRTVRESLKLASVVTAAVAVLLLALQNQAPTETRFLLWSAEMPRFALLGFVYLLGVVSGWMVRRRRNR